MNDDDVDGRHVLCQAKNHRENRTAKKFHSSRAEDRESFKLFRKGEGRSSVLFGRPSGPLRSATSALADERYFCATALVATPPPADFTQTVVGEKAIVLRN